MKTLFLIWLTFNIMTNKNIISAKRYILLIPPKIIQELPGGTVICAGYISEECQTIFVNGSLNETNQGIV